MDIGFSEALLLLGLIMGSAAALSGWLHGTVLSISVLSVLTGVALGLSDLIEVTPSADVVVFLVELALIVTLFSDGLFVEREFLQRAWGPPARALVIAMPVTLVLIAGSALILFPSLSWQEAFLLGAVLSPTDPVVTSAVVSAKRVPAIIRHTLNLESGLNDGLALPFVLFFLALAVGEGSAARVAGHLGAEALTGAAIGVALALLAGFVLRRVGKGGITEKYQGVYALALAFTAFGLAELQFSGFGFEDQRLGNGLIAVFVAGIALAVAKHDIPQTFSHFNESVSAIFQIATFVVFGALIVSVGWSGKTLALVAFVAFALFVARPVAVLLSFLRVPMPGSYKLFIAWFGPKGVASMLFALLVLNSTTDHSSMVFEVASFTILGSIIAHGLTDTVGADWIQRRVLRSQA